MGKYTKKRNCRKNKSMKKGGQYPDDVKNDEGRPAGPVDSTGSTSDSTTGATGEIGASGAPSVSTTEKKFSFLNPSSWFSSSKSTTGGRKNKQRKSKSKSKK